MSRVQYNRTACDPWTRCQCWVVWLQTSLLYTAGLGHFYFLLLSKSRGCVFHHSVLCQNLWVSWMMLVVPQSNVDNTTFLCGCTQDIYVLYIKPANVYRSRQPLHSSLSLSALSVTCTSYQWRNKDFIAGGGLHSEGFGGCGIPPWVRGVRGPSLGKNKLFVSCYVLYITVKGEFQFWLFIFLASNTKDDI